MNPKISIITPVYNREELFLETYQSVCNQTVDDWEMLVIDDGSTDATPEILSQITDSRVKTFTQKNQGVASARNLGLQHMKGKYVAFLDSDDLWAPDKLQLQIDTFDSLSDNFGLIYTDFRLFKNDISTTRPSGANVQSQHDDTSNKQILFQNFVVLSSAMVRREVMQKVGCFDHDLFGTEDWDLFIRIGKSYKFYFLNQELTYYRSHQRGISKNVKRQISEDWKVLRKHLINSDLPKKFRRHGITLHYLRAASMYYYQRKFLFAFWFACLGILKGPSHFRTLCRKLVLKFTLRLG
jgi:glycosyltransferase involved in cell wall biosynthesis